MGTQRANLEDAKTPGRCVCKQAFTEHPLVYTASSPSLIKGFEVQYCICVPNTYGAPTFENELCTISLLNTQQASKTTAFH